MYAYVAVLFLSHAMKRGFERSDQLLRQLGCIQSSLESIRFISGHIKTYLPTGSGEDGNKSCFEQRGRARHLSKFEALALKVSKKVFFSPL